MRTIVANLENMKLPTKHCGVTGETTRGSEETARRPPSVKAALSVSFGQRAPHRASTRDSSPVRRTVTSYDRDSDSKRSPSRHRSQSRDLPDREYSDRDRDRDRGRDQDRRYDDRDRDRRYDDRDRDRRYDDRNRNRDRRYDDRDRDRRYDDYDRRSLDRYRERSPHRSRSRSRSRSSSRSHCVYERSGHDQNRSSPLRYESKEKTSASSNLAKLKDLYGDLSDQKEDTVGKDKGPNRASGTEEVIRLGGSTWR